ncbi:cadherin-23-like isoform X2 [Pomacea canaliculata]|uniref:cadherin-23-like isoform X2 n=1 Tax=Pomacea canaliculata TaxID=400727 RepID=UPI000D72DD7A|nr:cadherin-23-like isoform X2 [Pomacea canaliculata]
MEKLVKQMLLYVVVTGLVLAVLAQQGGAPDYVTLQFSYHVREDTRNGTILFNFTARYTDRHRNVTVTSASPTYVTVEKANGSEDLWSVRLNNILDRETLDHIQLNFDLQGDVVLQVGTTLFVDDVNDNPPKFEKIFYAADVSESTRVGTTVFTGIKTTDPDDGIGKTVSYNMTYVGSSSQNTFTMDSITGSVHLTGPLDFEKINLYHYIVTATDGGGLNSTADLIFTVLDVQDTPPFFIGLPYTASVDEDTKAHTVLLQIMAEDGDRFPAISNAVKYSITGESCVGLFQLNNITGALSVGDTQLDRDSTPLTDVNGECSVTVQATEIDTHPPQLGNTTATTTVTITVHDLNDNAPAFSSPSFTATIKENSPPGVSLTLLSKGQIMVSDKDQGTNSLLTISLIQSGDTFDLEQTHIQSNGPVSIRVKNPAMLDYETSDTLSVTIVATDNPVKGPGRSASVTVTVNIQPVNEFTPEFIAVDIKVSVPEGSPVGYLVVNASAFDRDKGGSDGMITYSLQNDQGMFRIDPNTGVVYVASQATDRETKDTYNLLVQAQDGGGLLNSTSLTITIEDINDNKPIFQRTQYDAILSENSTTFTRPLRLEASDDDKPGTVNSNITYTLSPNSSPDNFHIDPLTGDLTVVRPLDYESVSFLAGQPGTITLTAVATDQGQPAQSSTVPITITLLDVNDNAPNFKQSSYSQIIKEDASLGSVVTTVTASDADGSAPNNLVSYFIESGAQDRFRISATSGEIKVSGPLDREQTSSYLLTIVARDQAENPKSSNCTVNITLSDVNDENPTFGDRSDVTIDVNETASGQLYVMTATDPDLNSQLRYSILWTESTGQSGIYTSLDAKVLNQWIGINNNTGALKALKPLDKTATRMFTLAIQVEDIKAEQNKPQSAKGLVKINIIDINNNSPRFSPSGSVTASVTENSVEGTALLLTGSIHVADLDENENSQFKLTLEGPFAQYFEVYPVEVQSSADVIIRVKNNTVLDYETRPTLDLNITAMETLTAEKRHDSLVVHVTIQDENDYSPVFTNHSYNASIPENATHGTSICTVNATDGDRSQQFKTVTYSLPDSNGLFLVDSKSGVVTVAQDNGLDYEKRQAYSLTVEATDGGGRRATATLNVVLTDINDNPPIFEKPEYSAFVTENVTSFYTPITVKATDADAGVNKEIEYFVLNTSTLHLNFTVDKSTGQLGLVSPLDYESLPDKTTGRVTLLVGARDHGSPSRSTSVSVVVTVKDANDCTPKFNSSLYHCSIPENTAAGSRVASVSATDADGSAPNNAIFFVLGSGGSGNFRVDSTTGEVTVALESHLDRDTTPAFNLTVLVLDRGDPPRSSSATVTVRLIDINDEPPAFNELQSSRNISENAPQWMTVAVMRALDRDSNPDLMYEIVQNETEAYNDRGTSVNINSVWDWFAINSMTGEVYVNSTCDRETAETVMLVLKVTDKNGVLNIPQTASAKITITLNDVNDCYPEIKGPQLLNVSEAVTIVTEVASFTATDRDRDQTVTFSIPDTTSSFSVTPDGKISLRKKLDRESQDTLSFTLVATDNGSPALSSNVTVVVNVIDANDNAPNITNANTTFFVFENATLDTWVALITAEDRDEGGNGRVSFGFEDDVQDFDITTDPGNNGAITVKNTLDREKKDTYTLSVVALDNPTSDFKLRSTKQIEIKVLDVNDNAPEFHPANTTIFGRVVETATKGDRVSDISPEIKVTDQDLGQNAKLTYQLTPEPGSLDLFTVHPATGNILVNINLTGKAGDYFYILTVTDGGDPPLSATANVTLKVIDVNLNAPRFVDIGPVPPVSECLEPGSSIYTFLATDEDKDKDTNGKVEYFLDNTTIRADDLVFFRLDRDSGVLTLAPNKKFDRETKSQFVLRILAKDKGLPTPLSTMSDPVTISINDTNDNPAQFKQSPPEFAVEENKYAIVVGSVLALDNDTDARTCYKFEPSEFSDYFAVEPDSHQEGVITLVKPLDREKQSEVTVTVTAHDCTPGGNCGVDTQTPTSLKVRVVVKDVNDNPPIFTTSVISAGFLATSEYGTEILNLQELVTDPDLGPNRLHQFYPVGPIEADASLNLFNLDSPLKLNVNGSLQTNRSFTPEMQGLFKWRVLANDSAGSNQTLLKLFIVGTDQIIRISLFHSKDELRTLKSQILSFMRNTSEYNFIDDGTEDFIVGDGKADPSRSVLILHAVDKDDKLISAATIQNELDHNTNLVQGLNKFQVLSIESAREAEVKANDSIKLEYVLVGIIAALIIAFLITLTVMIANIYRFKRKLKASTTESYPMTRANTVIKLNPGTMRNNPMYGKEQIGETGDDDDSRFDYYSIDDNNVDNRPAKVNETDEQEVTLDLYGTETSSPLPPRKGNKLLDEVLQEHELTSEHAKNGVSKQVSNGNVYSSHF